MTNDQAMALWDGSFGCHWSSDGQSLIPLHPEVQVAARCAFGLLPSDANRIGDIPRVNKQRALLLRKWADALDGGEDGK